MLQVQDSLDDLLRSFPYAGAAAALFTLYWSQGALEIFWARLHPDRVAGHQHGIRPGPLAIPTRMESPATLILICPMRLITF